MMINKTKTIKKAVAKYNIIYPVRGKHSLEECFFCLRGEYYFSFRTENKKVHKMQAEMIKAPLVSPEVKRETMSSLAKVLNKPIIIRSILTKKPVKACVINLFPNPHISWSNNHKPAPAGFKGPDSEEWITRPLSTASPSDVTPTLEEVAKYGNTLPESVVNNPKADDTGYIVPHPYPTAGEKPAYHYEILASGNLPVSPRGDLLPSLQEIARFSGTELEQQLNTYQGKLNNIMDTDYPISDETTTYHYEVLGTGYLPARDFEDELPSLDETFGTPGTPELPTLNAQVNEQSNIADQQQPYQSDTVQDGRTATEPAAAAQAYTCGQPQQEWRSWSNRTIAGYRHERPREYRQPGQPGGGGPDAPYPFSRTYPEPEKDFGELGQFW
jgi:hypothetical protein